MDKNLETAYAELDDILTKLERLELPSSEECFEVECKLNELTEDLRAVQCNITGGHVFGHDQCGLWQHMSCINCSTPKYPELIILPHSTIKNKMGELTEEEYGRKKVTQQ